MYYESSLDCNCLYNRFWSKPIQITSLNVLIFLIFLGCALGNEGIQLVTPLTILLKIKFENIEETQYFGLMIGNEKSLDRYEKWLESHLPVWAKQLNLLRNLSGCHVAQWQPGNKLS